MKVFTGFLIFIYCLTTPAYPAGLDDLLWTTSGGQVTIASSNPRAEGELIIPDTIDGDPVTKINPSAFEDSNLTTITIPDSVTVIGNEAFKGCTGLTDVTIGNSVTSIGDNAFWRCSNLTSITIPDSVTSIGEGAFYRCSNLTSITIPDSITSIGDGAFYGCTSLCSITIGDGVTSIGDGILAECTNLTSVTIPDSVKSIGIDAFYKCASLTSITIPDSVTSIGANAFEECTSLKSITIGKSVTSIGESAFYNCRFLKTVVMEGLPPTVDLRAFETVNENAEVFVNPDYLFRYGIVGETWYGLFIVEQDEEECDNEELTNTITTLVAQLAQKDAQIAEKNAQIVELEKRPSLEDIQETRAGSVVLTPTGNGTVILKMMIEKSSDLSVWENSEESVEVELPLAEGKKFLRFALK